MPFLALIVALYLRPDLRGKPTMFLTGAYGFGISVAIATGAFRGDNNNMGMPSARYLELFLVLPLATAVTLCVLYRASAGRWRVACMAFGFAWLVCQLLGFTIQTVYHVVPLLGRETGEWHGGQGQDFYRDVVRGRIPVPHPAAYDETINIPTVLADALAAHEPPPAMTTPMIVGFDLQPGSEGNYTVNGWHPSYQGRPARLVFRQF